MRFRIWALIMVVVPMLLTASLLTAFFVSSRLSSLEETLHARGAALARQVAAGSELGLFSGNRQMIEAVAAAALRDADVDAVIVRDEGGVVMARLGDDRAASLSVEGSALSRSHLISSEPVRRTVAPLDDFYSDPERGPSGDLGNVVVVMTTASLRDSRVQIITTALLVTSGLCTLVVVLVLVYVRKFGSQLVVLSDRVARIGDGDLSVQISLGDEDRRLKVSELDTLATGVDAMARQITASHRNLAQRVAEATAELELRRADAERANLAKSRFLAAASHDLRQPLHALGLFADQLSRRSLTGEDGRLVARIVESSGALSELLDALLDISRLDAGAMAPKILALPLEPLFQRLRVDFETQALERGLRFRIPPSSRWVCADPTMLERILINLVANAVRYTSSGAVMLATRRSAPGRIRLEVRDSGVGIRDDAQKLIFDEFVQLDNPERDRNKGLGLGLSIVQRMSELMNCRYGVRSQPGRGSVFWIELPTTLPVATRTIESSGGERQMTGRFVVVIEDDPLVAESVSDQLRSWGCEVCAAPSGQALIALLDRRGSVPDVILCDHRLQSGEQGAALVAHLRERFNIAIPAVLVTGDSGLQMREGLADTGFPILSKPVRPARLRAVLQGVFSAPPSGL